MLAAKRQTGNLTQSNEALADALKESHVQVLAGKVVPMDEVAYYMDPKSLWTHDSRVDESF